MRREIWNSIVKRWWALMSCTAFTIATVYQALAKTDDKWILWVTGILAIAFLVLAIVFSWVDLYRKYEAISTPKLALGDLKYRQWNHGRCYGFEVRNASLLELRNVHVDLKFGRSSEELSRASMMRMAHSSRSLSNVDEFSVNPGEARLVEFIVGPHGLVVAGDKNLLHVQLGPGVAIATDSLKMEFLVTAANSVAASMLVQVSIRDDETVAVKL